METLNSTFLELDARRLVSQLGSSLKVVSSNMHTSLGDGGELTPKVPLKEHKEHFEGY